MVRAPVVDENGLKRGAWSLEEDHKLTAYVEKYGPWKWRQVPRLAGTYNTLHYTSINSQFPYFILLSTLETQSQSCNSIHHLIFRVDEMWQKL